MPIPDANHWNLRGPVRSMRSEIAERDLVRSDWEAARFFNFVVFDQSGRVLQLDQRGAEQSIFRQTFAYDAGGRFLEWRSGSADGPITHVRFCCYDGRGRLIEVVDRSEDGVETTRERHTYDPSGRRAKIETVEPMLRRGNVAYGIDGSEMSYGQAEATLDVTHVHDRSFAYDYDT